MPEFKHTAKNKAGKTPALMELPFKWTADSRHLHLYIPELSKSAYSKEHLSFFL